MGLIGLVRNDEQLRELHNIISDALKRHRLIKGVGYIEQRNAIELSVTTPTGKTFLINIKQVAFG